MVISSKFSQIRQDEVLQLPQRVFIFLIFPGRAGKIRPGIFVVSKDEQPESCAAVPESIPIVKAQTGPLFYRNTRKGQKSGSLHGEESASTGGSSYSFSEA
jgi:hypothetical protein